MIDSKRRFFYANETFRTFFKGSGWLSGPSVGKGILDGLKKLGGKNQVRGLFPIVKIPKEISFKQRILMEVFYHIPKKDGIPECFVGIFEDITDRKKSEEERTRLIEKLEFLSKTDSLTGLLNRRALIESLEYEVDRAKRYAAELSLILCDMDYFKEINDTYGHVAGDAVLQAVSQAIRDSLRGTDITGRYGGDEFMVILPETPFDGAKNFAERIRLSVKKTEIAITENHNIKMSLSLGITCFNAASDNIDTIVRRADSALYEAKKIGGNAVHALDCLPIMPAAD